MGGKQSVPLTPQTTPLLTGTIKDTTIRSVIFNQADLEMTKSPSGQTVLKNQVTPELFQTYENLLRMMARVSRVIYCDSGIIRKVLLDPSFSGTNNRAVNDAITKYDKEFAGIRRKETTLPNSIEGRPMESYAIDFLAATPQTSPFCTYVSSPSDLTFMFLKGEKVPGLLGTDVVLAFKGSSTVANFKHDLMSQFTPVKLETAMPPGLSMSSGTTNNTVPASFLAHITDSWEFLDSGLKTLNPTRLFVTGHSLGGAYATLFTFILAEVLANYPTIQSIHLITVGSPTVMSDAARNTFNTHLDSGKVTLDRIVSQGGISDFIPSIPALFSHPGFQPLKTELYPEKNTGRAYNFDMIKKVFQKGAAIALGFTKAKRDYGQQSFTHSPNKIVIRTNFLPFPHAGYFDMTWLGGFRMYGMKNPGMKTHTFISQLFDEGITFEYKTPSAQPQEQPAPEPLGSEDITELAKEAPKSAGRRRTYRSKVSLKKSKRFLK